MVETSVKKRGKRTKQNVEQATEPVPVVEEQSHNEPSQENIVMVFNETSNDAEKVEKIPKKRGRKPKGGIVLHSMVPLTANTEIKKNVILHLKCFLKDLQTTNLFGSNLEGFAFSNNTLMFGENIEQKPVIKTATEMISQNGEYEYVTEDAIDMKDVWKKLKVLEHNLHINTVENKKSACFWDTCEFDNPQIYIPKYHMNDTYHVYGCFCSPECAVAHLMEENIDSSVKFERYQLINHIYSKVYNYTKPIKPAPNPYYMLEKFYGNLTIQEYRSLLKNDRLFLVVDKPLTRVMPELHEDNDDFIINNKIIPSNNYQVKKRMQQKKPAKVNILGERFGLVQQT